MRNINTGLNLKLQEQEDDRIWIAGENKIKYEVNNQSGDYRPYAQKDETQKPFGVDWMDCTDEGYVESIGQQVNYMIEHDIIYSEPIKDWLDEDGKFNGSERELAEAAGNTPQGNSMQNVLEAGRLKGIAPESYNPRPTKNISWNEYHSNSTAKSKAKALEFLKYFSIPYEKLSTKLVKTGWYHTVPVSEIKKHLKQAPLFCASATCGGWFTQVIISACSRAVNHAWNSPYANKQVHVKDSYPPFNRILAKNYRIPYVYKALLVPRDIILKNKSMKPKLYRFTNTGNSIFEKWDDGKYRAIPYTEYVAKRYGGYNNVEIVDNDEITEDMKEGIITEASWVLNRINSIFGYNVSLGDISPKKLETPKKTWWKKWFKK